MVRTFKYFTIRGAGNPQPLVGALVTAAYAAGTHVQIAVDDSSVFAKKDRVLLCEKDGTLAENPTIESIPDATHIIVDEVKNAHAGGAIGVGGFVALNVPTNSMYVQGKDGNLGSLFIGTSAAMVTATGAKVVAKLTTVAAGSQPNDMGDVRPGFPNADMSGQWWIDGTTTDSYIPSFGVV